MCRKRHFVGKHTYMNSYSNTNKKQSRMKSIIVVQQSKEQGRFCPIAAMLFEIILICGSFEEFKKRKISESFCNYRETSLLKY